MLKDVDVVPLNQAWLNLGQSWSKIKENNKKGKWQYEKQQKEFLAGKRKKAPKEFKESKPHFQSKRGDGLIHSNIERGFIKAEVTSFTDLETYKDEKKVQEAGKLRIEGKDYLMQDGDICYFRFNV